MRVDLGTISFPITIVPSSLTANVKAQGTGARFQLAFKQGDQTDTVKWSVVGHLYAHKVKDGRKVIDRASGYLAAGSRLDSGGPFEQTWYANPALVQTSLTPLKIPLPTRCILISFGTVIRAEGNERIFRNTELSKTGTELANRPIKCSYTTIVIEMQSI